MGRRGCLGAQLVERIALGFHSGPDLRVMGLSPALGSALTAESAWDSLTLSLSLSLTSKLIFKKKKNQSHGYPFWGRKV